MFQSIQTENIFYNEDNSSKKLLNFSNWYRGHLNTVLRLASIT